MRDLILKNKILSNGESIELNVKEFSNISFMVKPDNFSGTIKVYASLSEKDHIDFTQPSSKTNPYDTVQTVRVSDGKYIDGDTGIQFINDNDVRVYETNSTSLNSLSVSITENTGGSIEIDLLATN